MCERGRRLLIAFGSAVCVATYLFPYLFLLGHWWRWMPSTVGILFIGAYFNGSSTAQFFGLKMTRRTASAALALFIVFLPITSYVLFNVLNDTWLHVQTHGYTLKKVGQFFQVFNDETLLRAAALTILLRGFAYPRTASVMLAVLFAIGHHLLYRMQGSYIGWEAMTTLFSFGAMANLLFVRFGHIGYSLALHYAWNIYRFNSSYVVAGHELAQGETFNYVEGSTLIVAFSFVAFLTTFAAVSVSGGASKRPRQPPCSSSRLTNKSDRTR